MKKETQNQGRNSMTATFDAISVNEGFARMVVAAFLVSANPTIDEINDVKMAVSEAVTNAVIHGYEHERGFVTLKCEMEGNKLTVYIQDWGQGIEDIGKAKEPFFTTRPELERSGMGFAFMETFMDEVQVDSQLGRGTMVVMTKYLQGNESYANV